MAENNKNKGSTFWRIFKWILIFGLIFIVWQIVELFMMPQIIFGPWEKWIKTYSTPTGCDPSDTSCNPACPSPPTNATMTVESCLPLSLMKYSNSPVWVYDIAALFMTTQNQLITQQWQLNFLFSLMVGYAYSDEPDLPGSTAGFLTPKDLCRCIVPTSGGISWRAPNDFWSTCCYPKTGSTWAGAKDSSSGTSVQIPEGRWPQNQTEWRTFMKVVWGVNWTGMPAGTTKDKTNCFNIPITKKDAKDNTYGYWRHPSNFLWHLYQIVPNSNLVLAFVSKVSATTGGYCTGGQAWSAEYMNVLLGLSLSGGVGGWIGCVKLFGQGNFEGLAAFYACLWEGIENVPPRVQGGGAGGKKCDPASAASAGINGAIGGGMAGGMAAAALGAAGPAGWAILAAIAIGGAVAVLSADSQGCFDPKSKNGNGATLALASASAPSLCSAGNGSTSLVQEDPETEEEKKKKRECDYRFYHV